MSAPIVTSVSRGQCAICEQRIEAGPYMGRRVEINEAAFVVCTRCAPELADAIVGRTPGAR